MKKKFIAIPVLFLLICLSCSKTNNPAAPTPQPTVNVVQTVIAVDTQIAQQATAAAAGWTRTATPTVTCTATFTESPNATQTAAAIGTLVAQQETAQASGWTVTPSPNATQTAQAIGTLVAMQQTTVAAIWTHTVTATVTPTFTGTDTPNETLTVGQTLTSIAQTAIANNWTMTSTPTVTPTATPTLPPQAVYITMSADYQSPVYGIAADINGSAYLMGGSSVIKISTNSGNCTAELVRWGYNISIGSYGAGLALDSIHGVLYVANRDNNQIQSYDLNGNTITQWGTGGSGNSMYIPAQFSYPSSVAVDGVHNKVYVADTGNNRIQVFSPDGITCTAIWGTGPEATKPASFNGPHNIFVDVPDSKVYIADNGDNVVQVFDLDGNYQTQFGGGGSGNGQFSGPVGIWVDDTRGKIYVVDQGNYRVEVFSMSYNYITQWGSGAWPSPPGAGKFYSPWGVAVDSITGWIYVTDRAGSVQVFNINY